MIPIERWDAIVLGGGPAGLAAAIASGKSGARVAIVEREERLGGILKQCIHDGFGLVRYGEKLAGPEYARRFVDEARSLSIPRFMETFVHSARAVDGGYRLSCVSKGRGVFELDAASLVLATGCRERTDRQVFIHGDRPAGVFTAGLAQYLVNVQGFLPGSRCVILGSGDIGLIMARRLTLEGMEVEGVYEIKGEPSGLARNVRQCLEDFSIPLHLSTTVVEVHGRRRVESVTVAKVDSKGKPIASSERDIRCDALILSVGLIPENETALELGVPMDGATRGPKVDQNCHTLVDGVFCCGNALHVNDLVDYVSESGEIAGKAAAAWASGAYPARDLVPVKAGSGFLTAVPQFVDRASATETALFFRSNSTLESGARVTVTACPSGGGSTPLVERSYAALRPPEMERVALDGKRLDEFCEAIELKLEAKGVGA
jgi:thioredoxin reductase